MSDAIEVHVTECLCWVSHIKNSSRIDPRTLCAIAAEVAEIFEVRYGIQEAYHYEALNRLLKALSETLKFIKIDPEEPIDGNFPSWKKRCLKAHAQRRNGSRKILTFTKNTVDLMTHEAAALFQKNGIDGFKSPRVLSELEYHLADSYLDFLRAEVEGKSAKKFAHSLVLKVETLERVKTLKHLGKDNGNHKPAS